MIAECGDMRRRAPEMRILFGVLATGVVLVSGAGSVYPQRAASNQRSNVISNADWKRIAPAVSRLIQAEGIKLPSGGFSEPGLMESAYMTGDHIATAIVDLGSEGASTDAVVVIRIEQGKPMLTRFLRRNGSVATKDLFLDGASVMHSDEVRLLAEQSAVYTLSTTQDEDGKQMKTCKVDAYRWRSAAQAFVVDYKLAGQLRQRFCGSAKAIP